MRHKGLSKKRRQLIKKSIAMAMLLNMFYMSTVPAAIMAASESVVATTETSTTTTTTETPAGAVGQSGVQIPAVSDLGLQVESAVLMEASTGQVLMSIKADEALPPASMTKMMTEYIVADQVKQGKLAWDDMVTVGENPAKTIGSRIFLAQGDQHTVEELYIAMAVGSANDATVALAERVAGSEQAFVKMMNDTAKQMGMKTAVFINSTGLDRADMPAEFRPEGDTETLMSAMDAAILVRRIVEDHPDFARFTAIQSHKFRERDTKPIINYNWMLEENKNITNFKAYAYEGLDGMKTGHTARAKYCFAGTAERDGMRLISVVMGTANEGARFVETRKVLDYGFNNFELQEVVKSGTTVEGFEQVSIKKGKETTVPVITDQAVNFMVPKGAQNVAVASTAQFSEEEFTAPIAAGTKVGTVTYTYEIEGVDQPQEATINLVTAEEVEKGGWFRLLFRAIKDLFVDLFDGIKNLF